MAGRSKGVSSYEAAQAAMGTSGLKTSLYNVRKQELLLALLLCEPWGRKVGSLTRQLPGSALQQRGGPGCPLLAHSSWGHACGY